MGILKMRVGKPVSTEDGIKIDMNPIVGEHFHKVDGGLTIVTKDEEVADLFDEEEEMVVLFMTERQYQRHLKNTEQGEDSGRPPYTRNVDGSVTIDGKDYVSKEFLDQLKRTIEGPPAKNMDDLQKAKKTEETGTNEGGDQEKSTGDNTLKVGEALEDRDKQRVGANGPETQIE